MRDKMESKQHLFSLTGNYEGLLYKDAKNSKEIYGDLTELMIIIGKSLVNDKQREILRIDVPRLKEELILWRYYREGSIDCFLLNKDEKEEGSYVSTGIISILPLIIGNYDIETLDRELGIFACQTNQKTDNLVLFLLMGKVVHGVINQEYARADSLVKILKEYLIHLNYNRIFQEVSTEKRIDKISFEKEKIRWIIDLDRISQKEIPRKKKIEGNSQILFIQSIHLFLKYHENKLIIDNIETLDISLEAKVFTLLLMDLEKRKQVEGFYQRIEKNGLSLGEKDFLNEMDRYFNKLVNFEILKTPYNFEKYQNLEYIRTKELFSMKQGEKGKHMILKEFEIKGKEMVKNCLMLEVKTKSRYYKLKKPLAQS